MYIHWLQKKIHISKPSLFSLVPGVVFSKIAYVHLWCPQTAMSADRPYVSLPGTWNKTRYF